MKITFMRHGFANNSSSAHSLIFARGLNDKKIDGDLEFGWSNFVLASKEEKQKYLLTTLYSNYQNYNRFHDSLIPYDTITKFIKEEFVKFVEINPCIYNLFTVYWEQANVWENPQRCRTGEK